MAVVANLIWGCVMSDYFVRNLEHSTVLYETENNPLVKLAWNKLDSNYLAVIEMDEKFVTLLDTR